jgi:hypothetical protein
MPNLAWGSQLESTGAKRLAADWGAASISGSIPVRLTRLDGQIVSFS